MQPKSWSDLDWSPAIPAVDLASLPGTISLHPLDGGAPVLWANGELPEAVKKAGGGEWHWIPAHPGKPHVFVALARGGATLFIDGVAVVDCHAGEPYMPATHRPAAASTDCASNSATAPPIKTPPCCSPLPICT